MSKPKSSKGGSVLDLVGGSKKEEWNQASLEASGRHKAITGMVLLRTDIESGKVSPGEGADLLVEVLEAVPLIRAALQDASASIIEAKRQELRDLEARFQLVGGKGNTPGGGSKGKGTRNRGPNQTAEDKAKLDAEVLAVVTTHSKKNHALQMKELVQILGQQAPRIKQALDRLRDAEKVETKGMLSKTKYAVKGFAWKASD